MRKSLKLVLGLLFVSTGTALAELQTRGEGMVYDTDRNITWVVDMGLVRAMTWADANAWAENLTYAGYSDWRLPRANVPDASCHSEYGYPSSDSTGYHCTGGELGHLFYEELGGTRDHHITRSDDPDVARFDFENLRPFGLNGMLFWTGNRQFLTMTSQRAWSYSFHNGEQRVRPLNSQQHVLAVREGDVRATRVR